MTLLHHIPNILIISLKKISELPVQLKGYSWRLDVDFDDYDGLPTINTWNLLNAICYRNAGKIEHPAYSKEGTFQFFYFKNERCALAVSGYFLKCIKLLKNQNRGFIYCAKRRHYSDPYWCILRESMEP
jgi:hypothetical protein